MDRTELIERLEEITTYSDRAMYANDEDIRNVAREAADALRERKAEMSRDDHAVTNGEFIRNMADPGLALWLSGVIDCDFCPTSKDCHNGNSERSCAQNICDWIQRERES